MAALVPARVRPADTFVTLVDDTDLVAVIPDGDRPECVVQLRLSATEITGGSAINDIPWDYVDTTGPTHCGSTGWPTRTRQRSSRPQPGWSSNCAARWSCASGAGRIGWSGGNWCSATAG
jgi:hypothetical protein